MCRILNYILIMCICQLLYINFFYITQRLICCPKMLLASSCRICCQFSTFAQKCLISNPLTQFALSNPRLQPDTHFCGRYVSI
nr:MAG TPA: hypothetical protein [Caudoviricetes sp.]